MIDPTEVVSPSSTPETHAPHRPPLREGIQISLRQGGGGPSPSDRRNAAAEPKPAFLDLAAFAPRVVERETHHDDSYEAAMKAADLVFGKKIEPGRRTPPRATTGRVLPSLVETAAPPPEPVEPVRRKRGRPRGVKKAAAPGGSRDAEFVGPRRAPTEPRVERPAPSAVSPAPPPVAPSGRVRRNRPLRSPSSRKRDDEPSRPSPDPVALGSGNRAARRREMETPPARSRPLNGRDPVRASAPPPCKTALTFAFAVRSKSLLIDPIGVIYGER